MGEAMPSLRRDYLAALGIEPLVLRAAGAREVSGVSTGAARVSEADAAVSGSGAVGIARLQLHIADADPFAGEHAMLLRGVVRALGLDLADICFDPRGTLPVLAFDSGDTPAQVHAPALAALRGARAKRALWPALRRLRRSVRRSET